MRQIARGVLALAAGFLLVVFVELALEDLGLSWGEAVTPTLIVLLGGTAFSGGEGSVGSRQIRGRQGQGQQRRWA